MEMEFPYIDDLIVELMDALEDKEHRCEFERLDTIKNEECRMEKWGKMSGVIVLLLIKRLWVISWI